MNKKYLVYSPLVLLLALIVIAGIGLAKQRKVKNNAAPVSTAISKQEVSSKGVLTQLPLPIDDTTVSQAMVHYFISGTFDKLENTQAGQQIVLKEKTIPGLVLSSESRVSRITPPYEKTSPITLPRSDLKSGLNIVISAEYDLRSQQWIVRDVYIPTDKNS